MAPGLTETTSDVANGVVHKHVTTIENRLFINGEFVDGKVGKTFDVYNPATEAFVASVHEATCADVELAVNAAEAAFLPWSDIGALERASYFYKLADLLEEHVEGFNMLDAMCMGKPVSSNSESRRNIVRFCIRL